MLLSARTCFFSSFPVPPTLEQSGGGGGVLLHKAFDHLTIEINNYLNKCLEVARRRKHCRERVFLEWEEGKDSREKKAGNLAMQQLLRNADPRVWGIIGAQCLMVSTIAYKPSL